MSPPFIAVVGPTGSGKTALGVALAQALGTSVVSADSQLVYTGLDIGTAKPTNDEMQGIPHHMIDLVTPTERYTVARYREEALPLLNNIRSDGHVPIVVGGTGLYVRALLDPPLSPEVSPDLAFRAELEAWMQQQGEGDNGMLALHKRLEALDPRRASEIHFRNTVRILRALEIIEATGKPVPESVSPNVNDIIWIGLTYQDRDLMRDRIDKRIQAMLDTGWVEEVRQLMEQYGPEAHALQVAHGYPELIQYLQGQRSLESAIAQIETNIHQYARRQLTWYRQDLFKQAKSLHWFEIDVISQNDILTKALDILKR